jgi:hypothetical protein
MIAIGISFSFPICRKGDARQCEPLGAWSEGRDLNPHLSRGRLGRPLPYRIGHPSLKLVAEGSIELPISRLSIECF